MQRCYYKGIVESSSKEARIIEYQHPEIPLRLCKIRCSGIYEESHNCEFYCLHELTFEEVEEMEDSRLEDVFN